MEPSNSKSSLYSFEYPNVTDEDFNLFHNIDRELLTILIHNLGFDPALSMQVVAFFIWLEKQTEDMYLIKGMVTLPHGMLRHMVDEAVLCLKCAENDNFRICDPASVRLLPEFMNNPDISLGYFHENRVAVLKGVSEIIKTVCERAFRDILQRAWQAGVAARRVGGVSGVQDSQVAESSRMGEMRNVVDGGTVMPPLVQSQQPMHARQADVATGSGVPPVQVVGESSRTAERRNEVGGGSVTMMTPLVQPRQVMNAWQGDMGAEGGVPPVQVVGESSRNAEMRNEVEVGVGSGGMMGIPPFPQQPVVLYDPYLNAPVVQFLSGGAGAFIWLPMPLPPTPQLAPLQLGHNVPSVEQGFELPFHMLGAERFPVYDLEVQRQLLGNELGEMFMRNLVIGGNREEIGNVRHGEGFEEETTGVVEEEEEVPPGDRTIFLTFSKGYPISEDEVREFFTRKFGDFIEELTMQEVGPDEQVLYARLVVRSSAVIDDITQGSRAKYSINGKHVWARKFVKRPNSSSPGESSSSQQPNAPEE